MSNVVSARCFGCGHVIKVPAALGGKKARCPQCTNTITIPSPSDTHDDIVSDDQLTEVARDGDPINDDDEPGTGEIAEGELVEEDPSSVRRRSGTASRRSGSSSANLRPQTGTGASRSTQPRYVAPPAKKSGAGVAVGVALGVLVVGGIIISMTMGGGGASKVKNKAGGGQTEGPTPVTPASGIDEALQSRCLDYIEAVNKGDPAKLVKFFPPEEEAAAMRDVNRFLGQAPNYANYEVKKAEASSGAVIFKHSAGEKSITFKQVNGVWYVAEKPTP